MQGMDFRPVFDQAAREAWRQQTVAREEAAWEAVESYLPKRLRWLVDHPRLLRLAYRFRPAWRPHMILSQDGDVTVTAIQRKDGVTVLLSGSWRPVDEYRLHPR